MAYTTTKLISNAFHKAGIVSREFGEVSGHQVAVGLDELNKLLARKTIRQSLIPYYTKSNFTAVIGQEEYAITNLIDIETLTFNIGTVRYEVTDKLRYKYQGTGRANNVESLPYQYHFEPELNGGRIFLYFLPQEAYEFTLWGKFRLTSVTLPQDLELTLDLFYIDFLEMELAERLCGEYNLEVPPLLAKDVEKFRVDLKNSVGKLDTQIKKRSTLNNGGAVGFYGAANLGKGWVP